MHCSVVTKQFIIEADDVVVFIFFFFPSFFSFLLFYRFTMDLLFVAFTELHIHSIFVTVCMPIKLDVWYTENHSKLDSLVSVLFRFIPYIFKWMRKYAEHYYLWTLIIIIQIIKCCCSMCFCLCVCVCLWMRYFLQYS